MIFLNQSKIHGVGCFTDKPIKKGEIVLTWDKEDYRRIEVSKIPQAERKNYEKHAINHGKYYHAPKSFQRMFVGWYLNHSDKPNIVSFDEGDTWLAIKDIKKNEELKINYDLL